MFSCRLVLFLSLTGVKVTVLESSAALPPSRRLPLLRLGLTFSLLKRRAFLRIIGWISVSVFISWMRRCLSSSLCFDSWKWSSLPIMLRLMMWPSTSYRISSRIFSPFFFLRIVNSDSDPPSNYCVAFLAGFRTNTVLVLCSKMWGLSSADSNWTPFLNGESEPPSLSIES